MPDQHGGGGRPQPNEHVKRHLEKNHVDPDQLPGSVIETLNTCSEHELKKMEEVGTSLEDANVAPNLRISAVH
jgi:hypothetical protein